MDTYLDAWFESGITCIENLEARLANEYKITVRKASIYVKQWMARRGLKRVRIIIE